MDRYILLHGIAKNFIICSHLQYENKCLLAQITHISGNTLIVINEISQNGTTKDQVD